MVEEILSLGFESLELSHGIRSSQLEGVVKARERHEFSVSSLHNFLPMPVEVLTDSPDCYEFTSDRAKERDRALRLTLSTIDWAEKLGAPFVVVHTGRIRSLDLTAPLRKMVEQGKIYTRKFIARKLEAVQTREKVAELHTARILQLLREAVSYAGKRGVKLGIENREYFIEHGGEHFARIDCLNDSPQGMAVLQAVVARELQGWI